MKVDENGMCTLNEEDSSYHSCNTKRKICKCYHAERNFIGKIGVCWGTKECEACSCDGDESKCDFYEDKRKKATQVITNGDRIRSMSNTELAKWMEWHDYCPDSFTDAPCIGPDGEPKNEYDCYQCCLDWLNEEVESEEYLWGEKSNIK